MAKNEVFKYGDWVSLPVTADTASGSAVVVGDLVGVAQTKEGEGGNADGFASVALTGAFSLTVTGAVASYGLPIFIAADYTLHSTDAAGRRYFGQSLGTKGAGAGLLTVRLCGHAHDTAV
jgi:predicted RecA/RadA family phage recombinase